jgi:AcrR family transcriptional regulator
VTAEAVSGDDRAEPSTADAARGALTREAVVEAALARTDRDGLESLTFRALAGDLGVTPMALYRYVSSKAELLSAVADRAFQEFELPDETVPDWRERLRMLGRSYRRVLLAHPSVAAIERSDEPAPSADGMRIIEVMLDTLRQAGFSIEQAAVLHEALAQFVLALVMLETGGGARGGAEEQDRHQRELRSKLALLPAANFPNVMESAEYLCAPRDREASFELALDLLMGGLERLLDQAPSPSTQAV